MAAGNWIAYNKFKYNVCAGAINLASDHFRMVLVLDTYTPALTHETWADVSASEHGTSAGYTVHGEALTVTWTDSSGTETFTATADTAWTATGGALTARYAVIVKDADNNGALASTDKLVGYVALDSANVTASSGNPLTVKVPASGFFAMAGAAS
jgi:hypothetical protein